MKETAKNTKFFFLLTAVYSLLTLANNQAIAQHSTGFASTQSADIVGQDSVTSDLTTPTKSRNIGAFPIIFYSDETRLAGGAGVSVVYSGLSQRHSSSIAIIAFYTQNKQYNLQVVPEIYLKEEAYKIEGGIGYSYYPDKFYGIGNNTKKEDEEDFTSRIFNISASFQKRLVSHLYFGPLYYFLNCDLSDVVEGKILANKIIPGSEGGAASGVGITVNWDSRNNNLYPTSGSYHQFIATTSGPTLGSDFIFNSYTLDLRHYQPMSRNHILAFQGVFGICTGTLPFQTLYQLGSVLRGYYLSRFVDKNLIALQAEYRMPLGRRFGFVGFIGCGEVAPEFGKMSFAELKPSAGLGLRIALIPEQKVNLRIDFGFGKDDSSFDINIKESF